MEPENAEIPIERMAERMGLAFSKGAPMTIDSDELEVVRDDSGRERVVFRDNVRVVQGDLYLDCDWLQATFRDPEARYARVTTNAEGGLDLASVEPGAKGNVGFRLILHERNEP